MGARKYIRKSFMKAMKTRTLEYKNRIISYRKKDAKIVKLDKPTNPVRAKTLGFKQSKSYVVYRLTVRKGMRARPKPDQGRKPGKSRKFKEPGFSWQDYAENTLLKKRNNLTIVGSYKVGEDGDTTFYEVLAKLK
ncbi:50S ribosomal protein L15e [uncultured archaeon]|nr:50S ribosomal protein L15e [uncultured archaeon]